LPQSSSLLFFLFSLHAVIFFSFHFILFQRVEFFSFLDGEKKGEVEERRTQDTQISLIIIIIIMRRVFIITEGN
jgi:hypothetical protein